MKKISFFFVFLFLLLSLTSIPIYADSYGYIDSGDGVNVRQGPGTDKSIIGGIGNGEEVLILGEEKDSSGGTWYKINYNGLTGYVTAGLISDVIASGVEKESYESLDFPDSYLPYLEELKAAHPSWSFVADYTGLCWEDVIYKETHPISRNLVPSSYPEAYKSKAAAAYNSSTGEYTIFDSRDWIAASEAAVRFYMDPRNNMGEQSVFQFLSNKYNADTQTLTELEVLISGSFLDSPFPEEGYSTYAQLLMEAGAEAGVSPLTLASMIIVEQGYGGASDSINGSAGYYNYFNIGAYASGGINAVANGLSYAEKKNWNTRVKSIKEGALWFARNFVNQNQYTLYLKKFNVMSGLSAVGTGQYMTNVRGARSEATPPSPSSFPFTKTCRKLRCLNLSFPRNLKRKKRKMIPKASLRIKSQAAALIIWAT